MNTKTHRRGLVSRPLASSLALLLTMAMTVPVWAVVFTNPAAITINDPIAIGVGSSYPSNIAVSGMMGTVTSVTVTILNISSTFPPDADLLLVGPGGGAQNLIVMSDASSANDVTNVTITFNDAAAATIPAAGNLPSGSFKPTNVGAADVFPAPAPAASANTTLAAAFNGINPNGTWSLYSTDDVAADITTIGNGWSLTITTTMSSATSFTNGAAIIINDAGKGKASLYPSPITVSGLTGAITDINVTLTNVNHSFPDDIDILLVGPTGKRIILMADVGGDPDLIGVNITIDDQAATAFPDGTIIASGSFRPTNIGAGDIFPDQLPTYPNPATAAGAANAATLASVFNGTDPNGIWSLYVVDAFTPDPGSITGGWSVDITAGGSFGAKRFTNGDFDGDGKTDVAVQRPSTRDWFWRESTAYSNRAYTAFGLTTDIIVPGDYDGDRKVDISVFRPSEGKWYIVQSATNTLRQVVWGTSGDVPVPADYDGDGQYDPAVFRNGSWFVLQSTTGTGRGVLWGTTGDIPVQGHFEGTNGADFTVFRPADKSWYILNNLGSSNRVVTFGASGDVLVPGDYDADGKTDVAIYRDTGDWYILRSSTGTGFGIHLGASGDVPVPGDYDGDSRTDVAVWRPSTGSWYILNSGTTPGLTALRIDNWGQITDVPFAPSDESLLPPSRDNPIPRFYVPEQVVPVVP